MYGDGVFVQAIFVTCSRVRILIESHIHRTHQVAENISHANLFSFQFPVRTFPARISSESARLDDQMKLSCSLVVDTCFGTPKTYCSIQPPLFYYQVGNRRISIQHRKVPVVRGQMAKGNIRKRKLRLDIFFGIGPTLSFILGLCAPTDTKLRLIYTLSKEISGSGEWSMHGRYTSVIIRNCTIGLELSGQLAIEEFSAYAEHINLLELRKFELQRAVTGPPLPIDPLILTPNLTHRVQ